MVVAAVAPAAATAVAGAVPAAAAAAAAAAPAPDDGGCWEGTFESDGIGPSVATIRVRALDATALITPPRQLPVPADRRHPTLRAPAQPPVEKLETRLAKSSVMKETLDIARTIRLFDFGCHLFILRILASSRPSFSFTTDADELCAIFSGTCASMPNGIQDIVVIRRDLSLILI